jgi:hypothetical protein
VRGEEPLRGPQSLRAEAVMPDQAFGVPVRDVPGAEQVLGLGGPPDLCTVPGPLLEGLSPVRLAAMLAAGAEILECRRVLAKAGLNLVGEVLRGQPFVEMEHYPADDVFDRETHSQYYYHAHRGTESEHGHFHTFLRRAGMPTGLEPVAHPAASDWPRGDDAIAHLIGISMDAWGEPMGLFAVNRWVGGDTWYTAEDVIRMLDRFRVDHAYPSWPLNRWITAMFVLFRPDMEALLRHRDRVIAAWDASHSGDPLEDRALEITGWMPVDVPERIETLARALGVRSPVCGAGH